MLMFDAEAWRSSILGLTFLCDVGNNSVTSERVNGVFLTFDVIGDRNLVCFVNLVQKCDIVNAHALHVWENSGFSATNMHLVEIIDYFMNF